MAKRRTSKTSAARARDSAKMTRRLQLAAERENRRHYVLRLYVAGTSPRSAQAIRSITEICDKYLKGRCDLQVVDIYQQPTLAKGEQIIAAPTLIKKLPAPLRRLIGNLADARRVIVGLDIKPKPDR
jgi:circadian clock protein KaiB